MLAVDEMADGFHARHSARARAYVYRVLLRPERDPLRARRTYHWPHRIDRDALDAAAAAVVGTHDFRAFTPAETQHAASCARCTAAAGTRSATSCGS